jgi:hypothetical protein
MTWNNVGGGTHVITAVALDGDGREGSAGPITVNVAASGPLPVASVAASDTLATEAGTTTAAWTISLDGTPTGALSVGYVLGGTATNGVDYLNLTGTVVMTSTSATVTLTPINDSLAEGDETVTLTLSSSPGYTVGSTATPVTITDDDGSLPVASIAATDAEAAEAAADPGACTVTLSRDPTGTVQVAYVISGTATAGTDHGHFSGVVAISGTTGTLTITPTDDVLAEGLETVVVTLAAGTGYAIGTTASATLSITDNDTTGAGDLNGDRVVNGDDLTVILQHFGTTSTGGNWDAAADRNGDLLVNVDDFLPVLTHFGQRY